MHMVTSDYKNTEIQLLEFCKAASPKSSSNFCLNCLKIHCVIIDIAFAYLASDYINKYC